MKVQYLKIEFNNKKEQRQAKMNGFVWNPDLKLWEHKSREAVEIPEHYSIAKYAVVNQFQNEIKVNNSGLGDYGVGCYTTAEKAYKYGYDAIER